MKPQRIAVVAEFAPGGGAERYLLNLLDLLNQRDWSTTLVYFISEGAELDPGISTLVSESVSGPEILAQCGVKVSTKRNPIGYLAESRAIKRYLAAQSESIALCVSSVCSPGRFLNWSPPGIDEVQVLHSYPRGFKHRLAGLFFRLVAGRTHFVCVSNFLARKLSQIWLLRRHQITVVPNSAGEERQRETPHSSTPEILTVGSVSREKDPFLFLKVAEAFRERYSDQHPQPVFVWVGDGPLRSAVQSEVVSRGLTETVTFVGHRSDLDTYYRRATCYLQASRVDSMPFAVLDAMRFGVPCVVADVGGLTELFDKTIPDSVVSRRTGAALAERLHQIIGSPDLYDEVSRQTTQRYHREYSQELWTQRTLSTLERGPA